ncbi:MAG: nucleotidyltransferase domain-containing protein [Deltaproteobacteria bacterium]|nr:nucleotidyltransferase domain-containing protein [Deltaproteobacteria bacterium]
MFKHHKEAVFALAKELSSLDIYSVILFGSVAKGTATEKSDLDILVLLNTETLPTKAQEEEVFKIVFTIESKFDVHIEILISNKNLGKLDKFFAQHILSDGLLSNIQGIKVRSGVILISSSHLDTLISFLNKFHLPHYEHNLWMHA